MTAQGEASDQISDQISNQASDGASDGASGAGSLAALLARQRSAFLADGPPPLERRRAALRALKAALVARRRQFEAAARADFGHRPAQITAIMDLAPVVQAIKYQHRHLRRWMRPERRRVALTFQPGRAHVIRQPLGVVGILSPWNYPVSLALVPLATALAAGNRAMVKPSELTPATTELLAAMLGEIFPQEQVAVVTGGADVGAAFSALPFDHLVFTGSTAVGRKVMRAAADTLVPLTLELGGKSPVIVEPGHPVERAAADIAFGKTANAGQTCIAPDYVLVHAADLDRFVAAYVAAVRHYHPGGTADPAYTSMITARHAERQRALLDDAREKGARVIEIEAEPPPQQPLPNAVAPAVLLDVTDEMTVMQEEIFGPLLPVLAYRSLDEAIAFVNARPRPLALYFFGVGRANRDKVLAGTTSGNVTVNDVLLHYAQDDLPFGGVGQSGMGAYHGVEGFRALSHAKGVFEQARWNTGGLIRPPFGRIASWIAAYLMR
ncbi:coniferyl aldehyde dehydrogenase [Polymorphum gilvum]|uniref:Aldehyde dehydrogenase n=1 Tax=Polymorphum gilvum (strain LMG 25793 / CGMCC 1.9160 / SL003B-26A1) TaxID=991905 RepID=F2J043_POLGS|nr:coniferyl aldehyde dehydrogenase [Polymorphum gilvum]ADZ71878.1 Aldehyde dehydrogenase (NAD) family protein [Polymorphum gilvum SL003B-26A1]